MSKNVKYLIPAYEIDMGGIMIKQALPTVKVSQVDPFLLLHHAKFSYTENAPAIQQGLGPHPHRGFTPVSFVIEGEVHHRDSRGNNQIAKKGEVQWMHAGAGIIHSERPSQDLANRNGTQEVVQLWINSPAAKKMQEPRYQYVAESDIPRFISKDKQLINKLIAGNYNGLEGIISTESELLIIWSVANDGGTLALTISKKINAMLYVISGGLKITGYGKVEQECLVVFENNATNIEISTDSNTQFLLLAGVAINEKVVHHGPYVMNSETEILEAMRDYQMGKMGVLIEEN
ncbi:MAG: pirin family protein [Bacteroidia bacterium]|nr:MAG: pirin family protein [Bacteroidia bacterium]